MLAETRPEPEAAESDGPNKRPTKVIIWDLDDTLIIWDSLSKGTFDMPDGVCDELWKEWFALSKRFQEEQLYGSMVKEAQVSIYQPCPAFRVLYFYLPLLTQAEGVVGPAASEPLHSLATKMANSNLTNAYNDIRNRFKNKADRVTALN